MQQGEAVVWVKNNSLVPKSCLHVNDRCSKKGVVLLLTALEQQVFKTCIACSRSCFLWMYLVYIEIWWAHPRTTSIAITFVTHYCFSVNLVMTRLESGQCCFLRWLHWQHFTSFTLHEHLLWKIIWLLYKSHMYMMLSTSDSDYLWMNRGRRKGSQLRIARWDQGDEFRVKTHMLTVL